MDREEMILAHLPLVRFVVAHMAHQALEDGDALGAGAEGLIHAVDGFDPERGTFASYAVPHIRGAVLDAMREADRFPRITRHHLKRLAAAELEELARTGERPGWNHLVALAGLNPETAAGVRHLYGLAFVSLDNLDQHEGWEPPDPCETPEEHLDALERQAEHAVRLVALRGAVRRLEPRLRLVIALYVVGGWRFQRIGRHLGFSESRACHLHKRALRLLRADLEAA